MKYIDEKNYDNIEKGLNKLERLMAMKLITKGIKFIPQYNIKIPRDIPVTVPTNGRKSFIVDFLIGKDVVIEVDGKIHFEEAGQIRDRNKDNILASMGYKVFRFTFEDVFSKDNAIFYLIQRNYAKKNV